MKKGRRWQQRTPTPHISGSTPIPPKSFAAQKGSEATSFLPAPPLPLPQTSLSGFCPSHETDRLESLRQDLSGNCN